jgi:hypothetical protein
MSMPMLFPRQLLPHLQACARRQDWFVSQEEGHRVILLTNAAYSQENVTKRLPLVLQVTDAWDVRACPSTAWDQIAALPTGAAIYYVLNNTSAVLYVGESTQVRQRWTHHHRRADLATVGATRIAWQAVWPEFLLLEGLFIHYCRPRWQRQPSILTAHEDTRSKKPYV